MKTLQKKPTFTVEEFYNSFLGIDERKKEIELLERQKQLLIANKVVDILNQEMPEVVRQFLEFSFPSKRIDNERANLVTQLTGHFVAWSYNKFIFNLEAEKKPEMIEPSKNPEPVYLLEEQAEMLSIPLQNDTSMNDFFTEVNQVLPNEFQIQWHNGSNKISLWFIPTES